MLHLVLPKGQFLHPYYSFALLMTCKTELHQTSNYNADDVLLYTPIHSQDGCYRLQQYLVEY